MNNEKLEIIISATTDALKKGVKEAQNAIEKLGTSADKNAKKMDGAFSKMGKAAKSAGSIISKGFAAIGAAGAGLIASTEEMRQNIGRVEAAAKQAGVGAETATNAWRNFNSVMGDGDAAAEATQQLLKFAHSQAEVDNWSTIAAGSIAQFGDALPVETLMEGVNETVSLGEATGGVVQAIEQMHGNVDEFNKGLANCATAEERAAYAMDYFNGTLGEAGEQYLKSIERQNAFNDSMFNVQLALTNAANAILPVASILTDVFASALTAVTPALDQIGTSLADMINGVEGSGDRMAAGITNLLETAVNGLSDGILKFQTVGIELVQSLIQGIGEAAPTMLNTVAELIPQIVISAANELPQMLQVGIDLILGIVDGLTSAIPTLVSSIPQVVESVVVALTEAIPTLIEGAIQLFNALVQAIPIIIPEIIAALPQIITSVVNGLITAIPQLIQGGIQLFLALIQAIPVVIPTLVAAIPQIITAIGGALIDSIPEVLECAKEMFMAIPDAIGEIIPSLGDALGGVFDNIVGFFTGTKEEAEKSSGDIAKTVNDNFSDISTDMSDYTKIGTDNAISSFNNLQSQASWKMDTLDTDTSSKFSSISNTMKKELNGAKDGGVTAMTDMHKQTDALMNKVKTVTQNSMKALKKSTEFTWSLPKLKMPHIKVSGSFSINPPRVPSFSISWYAKGGVFDSPTLFGYGNGRIGGLGEAGAEAIVPLENNPKWIDALANRMVEVLGGGSVPVYIYMDKLKLGEGATNAINAYSIMNNKCGLVMP